MSHKYNGVANDQPTVREVRAYCEGREFAAEGGSLSYATGVSGVPGDNNALQWTAKVIGAPFQVILKDPGDTEQALAITVTDTAIIVSLETDVVGDIASLASEIITAIEADSAADALVAVVDAGESAGTGIVVAEIVTLQDRATGTTGVVGNNNAIAWTTKIDGPVSIALVDPSDISQSLAITVTGSAISVSLATDGAGVITSTAAQIITAIEADEDANPMVLVGNYSTSTGAGVVVAETLSLTPQLSLFGFGSRDADLYAAGFASWSADPSGVAVKDSCAHAYGGGFA